MTDQDLVLAKQAGDYVTKVYTPPVRSKTPGKIWEDGHVGWHAQFNAKFAALTRADERKSIVTMLKDEVNVETAADCIWAIEAREYT